MAALSDHTVGRGAPEGVAATGGERFPSSDLGRLAWHWWPVAAMMALIFAISGTPNLHDIPGGLSDHTGHFAGYALLGGFALRAVAQADWAGVTIRRALTAWALSAAYGITDEFHQLFVAGRTSAIDDWVADSLGAAAAVAVLVVAAVGRRLEDRKV